MEMQVAFEFTQCTEFNLSERKSNLVRPSKLSCCLASSNRRRRLGYRESIKPYDKSASQRRGTSHVDWLTRPSAQLLPETLRKVSLSDRGLVPSGWSQLQV